MVVSSLGVDSGDASRRRWASLTRTRTAWATKDMGCQHGTHALMRRITNHLCCQRYVMTDLSVEQITTSVSSDSIDGTLSGCESGLDPCEASARDCLWVVGP